MIASNLTRDVGKLAMYPVGDMLVRVRIADAKQPYGNLCYLIEPIAGTGRAWVRADKVTFDSDQDVKL